MKKPIVNILEPPQQQLNSLLKYYQAGRYVDAEKLSLSVTQEFPGHPFAWKILGAVLKLKGKINESLVAFKKSVQLDPQDASTHYNLGIILNELGRLEEAETSYKKAITLKPDYSDVHNNLGNFLIDKGESLAAIDSYKKAIKIKPDFVSAWHNIYRPLQVIKSQTSSIEKHLSDLDKVASSNYNQVAKTILRYRLNQGSPSTKNYYNKVLEMLSSVDNNLIKNPKVATSELKKKPTLPEVRTFFKS